MSESLRLHYRIERGEVQNQGWITCTDPELTSSSPEWLQVVEMIITQMGASLDELQAFWAERYPK